MHAVKRVVASVDASREDPVDFWMSKVHQPPAAEKESDKNPARIINIYDYRLSTTISKESLPAKANSLLSRKLIPTSLLEEASTTQIYDHPQSGSPLNLLRIKDGDTCPKCSKETLKVQRAVELGHTFFLGTRYSEPLRAYVTSFGRRKQSQGAVRSPEEGRGDEKSSEKEPPTWKIPLQMGCHGIGVSRMIGAVADSMADEIGLNWPRVIAPFEVVIIAREGFEDGAEMVYDVLSENSSTSFMRRRHNNNNSNNNDNETARKPLDVVLDDRQTDFIWKIKDAELIGFPVIVILGRAWVSDRVCEVQCRRLGNLKVEISLDRLRSYVAALLDKL